MIVLHSFLLSFARYSGLLLIVGFSLFSHQCFVLVLFSASFWVLILVISVICLFMVFFISFLDTLLFDLLPWIPLWFHWFFPSRCCFRVVSFSWLVFHFFYFQVDQSMGLHDSFLLMISSMDGYPVSLRRRVVWGSLGGGGGGGIVFRASLKIVCVFRV